MPEERFAPNGNDSTSSNDSIISYLIPFVATGVAMEKEASVRVPQHTSILSGSAYYRELMRWDTNKKGFRNVARMTRPVFLLFLDACLTTGLRSTRYIITGKRLLLFLCCLGHKSSNRELQERFQHSGRTISLAIHHCTKVILSLQLVRRYDVPNVVPNTIASSPKFYPFFRTCIGALDGSHIPVSVRGEDAPCYRNRMGFLSQNVLVVVDFKMQYIYCLRVSAQWAWAARCDGEGLSGWGRPFW
ncbi:MAG: hypothetical protein ACRDL7_12380 [Gaiellaceae bacterium]